MTIQQLEYILAVDQFRHFARAAEYCRVTQPTLSAMIQKLEEELGVKLFDRTVQPVCPTAIGEKIIDQARVILAQTAQVKEIISESNALSGKSGCQIPYFFGERLLCCIICCHFFMLLFLKLQMCKVNEVPRLPSAYYQTL